jgi:hypothetical protein
MSRRAAAWVAWSGWLLSMVALALSLLLTLFLPASGGITDVVANSVFAVVFAAIVLSFSTVGALIATRQPQNPIGWIMIVAGFGLAATILTGNYVEISLVQPPGRLPATEWVAWVAQWVWVLGFGPALTFLLLLFPNGRLPSRRWRPVGWLAVAAMVTLSCGVAFMPGPLPDYPQIRNPVGLTLLEGSFLAGEGGPLLYLSLVASTVLSASSMVVRFRQAVGEERQQIKWFAFAAGFAALGWVVNSLAYANDEETESLLLVASLLLLLSLLGIPLAVGIAILKYRLYDIDLIINRTLVYGSLTATLALVYVGSVVSLQALLRVLTGQDSTLAIVASTLLIAALFNPLRRRLQSFIDRRFYRRKYDAAKTLAAFGSRLREETDLDALSSDVVEVARGTMQPAHVSLWLRPDAEPEAEPEARSPALRQEFGHNE